MCCHLSTLRCTILYDVITAALRTSSATPPRARALAPDRTSHAPVQCKGKKYTLPLTALTKRNPPRRICRRLWCILWPGCSSNQSMILRRTTRNSPRPPSTRPPSSTNHKRSIRSLLRPAGCTTKHALYRHAK